MGKDLFDNCAVAREVFEAADDALGFRLSEMCFSGDEADLQLTANTQPAILTVSIAAYRAAVEAGMPQPDVVAGHSLGEYSALVAAGVLNLADAVRVVRKRGTYMQEAVPVGVGSMAAIMGLDLESIEDGCREAADGQVCSPANVNSASQVVIAGNTEAIERACEILKAKGAKRAIKLNVSAPFHCALMMPAQERLAVDLEALGVSAPSIPVVHNVDALPNSDVAVICDKLTRQVSSPVLWLRSVEQMSELGVETFIEVGPGKVLTGLVRQIASEAKYSNIDSTESLNKTLEAI